jgi:long-chain acyl-CoA synthetase
MNPTNTIVHNLLEKSATIHPNNIAVIHDDQRVTYSELNTRANSLANHLQANSITKGDRIALLLENSIDYITAYYATLKAGAVAAPLNPGLKPDGLQYLLQDLEPTAIITTFKSERLLKATNLNTIGLKHLLIKTPKQSWPNTLFKVQSLEETQNNSKNPTNPTNPKNPTNPTNPKNPTNPTNPTNPDALASIIYTSGSTGEPKGVMLSHKNIVSNTNSICQYLEITHTDIQMIVLPFFYVMGKSLLNTHIASGATVVLNNRFMYPADVVNQMIEEQVTSFSGVPSTYAYLLNRSPLASCRDKLHHLRYCSQAGGHMAKATKHALRKALPDHTKIVIMYGATEAAARLTYLDPDHFDAKIESIGKPIKDVSIRLLDKNANEVPDGLEGELVASGPNIMLGYWKAPRETARVLNSQGYHTGDIGYRDADGFLFVKGRKDGLLKVGGHRINPTEIEDFLLTTDLIIEAAVVGLPDQLLGTKLIALIVPKEDTTTPKTLMEKCANGLPTHKHPAAIITTRALPKNPNGKIDQAKCLHLATQQTQ